VRVRPAERRDFEAVSARRPTRLYAALGMEDTGKFFKKQLAPT
jgi:hypothetical protein